MPFDAETGRDGPPPRRDDDRPWLTGFLRRLSLKDLVVLYVCLAKAKRAKGERP